MHARIVSLLLLFFAAVATPGEAYLEVRLPHYCYLGLFRLREVVELRLCLIDRAAADADWQHQPQRSLVSMSAVSVVDWR